MVSISLYRGNLHRVSDAPRRWEMPPRTITLEQFRVLTRRRDAAIARLAAAQKAPEEEGKEEEGEVKDQAAAADPQPVKVDGEAKGAAGKGKQVEDGGEKTNVEASNAAAVGGSQKGTAVVKKEVKQNQEIEKRRAAVEEKLQVLKEKKHHLVQMLKLILNAEEEIKRRNMQSAALRFSVPPQTETSVDMGSATGHVPKLSVEVNFGGDVGIESDATAAQSAHGRPLHHVHSTSPSAGSFVRPFQQHPFLSAPRSNLATPGHGQLSPNLFAGNAAVVASSPSRFAPSGHQGHHHSASLPPVSVPGSHFMASSPSPAASGGSSSVFKEPRLTSSS